MTEARKEMSFWKGLARLFRFDTLSANWREVLMSFEPATAALLMAATPIIAEVVYKKLKEAGWVS